MKKLFISSLAILAMASCSKNEDLAGQNGKEIKMKAGVTAPVSRAAIGQDASGKLTAELTGVQFLRADGTTADWTTVTAPSFTGTIAVSGAISPSATQFYPTDGSNANIMGYYPAASGAISGSKIPMTITGAEDVIYAAPVSGSKSSALGAMTFTHKLTQFTFVASRTADLNADVTNVKISVKDANTTFTMAIADGTLAGFSTPAKIDVLTSGTATEAGSAETEGFMLEPGQASVTLTVSGTGFPEQDITVSPTSGNFLAGSKYKITVQFGAKQVAGTASIGKWNDGEEIVKPIE